METRRGISRFVCCFNNKGVAREKGRHRRTGGQNAINEDRKKSFKRNYG